IKLAREGRGAVELALPGLRCTSIAIETRGLEAEGTGSQPLVRATAWTMDGQRIDSTLRATGDGRAYRARADLPGPRDLARLRLETVTSGDALRVERITLHDAGTGHTLVLGAETPDTLASLRPVPHRLEVEFPPALGSALVFVSAISGPTTLAQGQAMARVSARATDG